MNNITEKELEQQWCLLMETIELYVTGKRKDNLVSLYESLADRICTAPASSHSTRHNCFPGGYLDHVNRVVRTAIKLYHVWQDEGADVTKYTLEEVVFSALNHDLGKIGSVEEEYYIPNDSDWHVKRGQVYKINPNLQYMKVPDRSIFLLQQHGVSFSENEYLAIKLHDGLYAKGNESYLMAGMPEFALKTDLPILIHHADHLATLIESASHSNEVVEVKSVPKTKMATINNPKVDDSLRNALSNLFGE